MNTWQNSVFFMNVNFHRLKMPARTLADPFVLRCLCSRGYFGSSPGPDEREAELLGFGAA